MRCESCGVEMASSSPSAEFLYWQSDGPGGFVSLCASCARRTFKVRDQTAEVISETDQSSDAR